LNLINQPNAVRHIAKFKIDTLAQTLTSLEQLQGSEKKLRKFKRSSSLKKIKNKTEDKV
jgi:hypothetical protein